MFRKSEYCWPWDHEWVTEFNKYTPLSSSNDMGHEHTCTKCPKIKLS